MARGKRSAKNRKKEKFRRSKEEWEEMKKKNPALAEKAYKLSPRTNPKFETFYQGIGIIPEEEWDTFLETMRKDLPATFRITGSRSQAQELLKIIKGQYFSKFLGNEKEGRKMEPQPIPWYPEELAWQLDMTKKEIKNESRLKSLHGFLISETESGNISRQEAVSMIPPLLLDVKPHHKVLDMCAAPGSKTAQLIELLHSDENQPIPEGFVIANDMDNKRCYLMTHQVKRIQSPNCMIINHDARILPNMSLSKEEGADFLRYDRVLCDVPCSGDGTMRKNPDIWSKWHVNGAYNLHRIQKKVLQRGLELLAVGGKLVYSTCSLNPVEDEAVILTLLKQCGGSVELMDVSDKLPGLKYSKGTYSWKILSKDGTWYETLEQAPANFQNSWDSTMYPPIITEAQEAKLERCIRILPHQQNTGAFFIAVLQKTAELPWSTAGRKPDPVINTTLKMDPSEKRDPGAEHFSFGVRSRTVLMFVYLDQEENQTCSIEDTDKKDQEKTSETGVESDCVQIKDTSNDASCETKQTPETTETDKTLETTDSGVQKTEVSDSSDKNTETADVAKGQDGVNEGSEAAGDLGSGDTNCGPPPLKKSRREIQREKEQESGEYKVRIQGHKEDPFYFCGENDPIWPSIKQYFGLSDNLNLEQIMYRNMKRILYFVSQPIRRLVLANDHKVKFINLGVKCFSNAPSPLVNDCDYRLSQEGLLAIQRYITARRVSLTKQDVITILSNENPFICKLSAKAQDEVYSMGPGSTLFHFKPCESDPEPIVEIVFCGWRGKTSVRSFVAKDERSHYLRMCGVELTDIKAMVQAEKVAKTLGASLIPSEGGTETPVGIPSGDEEEVKKWNVGEETSRGMEEDDKDENGESINDEVDMEVEEETAKIKTEPKELTAEIKAEPKELIGEIKAEPKELTAEIKTEPKELTAEIKTEPKELTAEIKAEPK